MYFEKLLVEASAFADSTQMNSISLFLTVQFDAVAARVYRFAV